MSFSPDASNDDLELVANAVIEPLHHAGIKTFRELPRGEEPGVNIEIDSLDDELRGIYLSWYPGAYLRNQVIQAVKEQRVNDPSIRRFGEIVRAKLREVASVLHAAGIETEDSPNDYAPLTLWIPMTNDRTQSP